MDMSPKEKQNISLARTAFEAFRRGDYATALKIYHQLSTVLGERSFRANILLCEKRLDRLLPLRASGNGDVISLVQAGEAVSRAPLKRTGWRVQTRESTVARPQTLQLMGADGGERLLLSEAPIWCALDLDENEHVRIEADVIYENIPLDNDRKALVVVEYFDVEGNLIRSHYPGFSHAEGVGWYRYLAPPAGSRTFSLTPPKGAARVRLGFRSFLLSGLQRVAIAPVLSLQWLDNRESERTEPAPTRARPWLPMLSFEESPIRTRRRLTVASVLDAFSHACFEHECELIPITPGCWRDELFGRRIDLVLVESAWHGNDGAWQYRIAKYGAPPGDEISEVLGWARRIGIPTVFWNKEDPPNFDRFIDRAATFDYIFTTDENCINRYERRVPSSTFLGVLPFAAQPRIHNSLIYQPRLNATSFAGTYYADDFEPRRRAMNMLLRVAARYGLDIFDRMHGVGDKESARYAFPNDLQTYIRGSLPYQELLKAYRRYRVALNVNSVSDSPTMFSRRVFELLACGTPVVSTQSLGIRRMFGELVPIVESEDEAVAAFDALMNDAAHWLRASVRGMRSVFLNHTYAHRLETIAVAVGLASGKPAVCSVVVVVLPAGDSELFASRMRQQRHSPIECIVIGARYADPAAIEQQRALLAAGLKAVVLPPGNICSYVRHRHADAVIALCDSRDHYGARYLEDASYALAGTPEFSASTMVADEDMPWDAAGRGFDAAARIGLPIRTLRPATLVARPGHPLLMEMLAVGQLPERVDMGETSLRSRAAFDYLSHRSLAMGLNTASVDLD